MNTLYTNAISTMERENTRVNAKVDELLLTLVGKDTTKKITVEEQAAIEKPYRDKNEVELVDPLNLYEKIQELKKRIDGFNSSVDVALSLSNATTFIEVDF